MRPIQHPGDLAAPHTLCRCTRNVLKLKECSCTVAELRMRADGRQTLELGRGGCLASDDGCPSGVELGRLGPLWDVERLAGVQHGQEG
mgnify:FL=1